MLVIAPMTPVIQQEHRFPVASLGIIFGVSLLTGVVAELFLGPQADRGHERALLIGSVVLAGISSVGSGLADSVLTLTLWRAVAGVSYGMFVPAASALVIRLRVTGVGERIARLQVAEFAGFAAGPFLGALLLAQFGTQNGLIVAGIATLMLVPVVLGVDIPHERQVARMSDSGAVHVDDGDPSRTAFDLLRRREVWVALLLSVAVTAPVGTYSALWPKFLADRGAGPFVVAVSLAIFTLPFMILAPIAGRLIDRIGPLRGSVIGIWIVVVAVVSYGLLGSITAIILVSLIESVGQALAGPGSAAAMARASGARRAGAGQGLARGVGFLGAGLTAIAAGPVYQYWGGAALFACTAAIMVVLVILAQLIGRNRVAVLNGTELGVDTTT